MPVEIKELYIKINVTDGKDANAQNDQGAKKEDLIAECMEQVMEIMDRKDER